MIYFLLDTSTPVCRMTLVVDGVLHEHEWQADRTLAKNLLGQISNMLAEYNITFQDINGLGVFRGPGSFTGLRIGITVLNTIADSQAIAIVGGINEDWKATVVERLDRGENERIVLPFYGRDARITAPRK